MKYCLLLTLSLIFCFSFIRTENSQNLDIKDAKKQCQEIFSKLKKVHGLTDNHAPKLFLVPSLPELGYRLAMADNLTGQIFIEHEAYRIAIDSLGDDAETALAWLLAHELAHYNHKHGLRHQFIKEFSSGAIEDSRFDNLARTRVKPESMDAIHRLKHDVDSVLRLNTIRANEAEADLEAGFTAFLAGYETGEIGSKYLGIAYSAIGISANSGKYASLAERQEIIRKTSLQLDTLMKVFETGNLMNILGDYSAALKCYQYIYKDFQTKELLNNMGVLSLQELSTDFCGPQIGYALPLTLDLSYGVNAKGDTPEEIEADRRRLLKKHLGYCNRAIEYFDEAQLKDHSYVVSYLNKSIAYFMKYAIMNDSANNLAFAHDELYFALAEVVKAKQLINADKSDNKVLKSNIYAQLAIVHHALRNSEKAEEFISKASSVSSSNELVQVNRKIFNGDKEVLDQFLGKSGNRAADLCDEKEKVLAKDLVGDVIFDINKDWDFELLLKREELGIFDETTLKIQHKLFPQFEVYRLLKKINESESVFERNFIKTTKKYDKPSVCDIKLNESDLEDLKNAYGSSPHNRSRAIGSRFISYQDEAKKDSELNLNFTDGIIFRLDGTGSISQIIFTEMVDSPTEN